MGRHTHYGLPDFVRAESRLGVPDTFLSPVIAAPERPWAASCSSRVGLPRWLLLLPPPLLSGIAFAPLRGCSLRKTRLASPRGAASDVPRGLAHVLGPP